MSVNENITGQIYSLPYNRLAEMRSSDHEGPILYALVVVMLGLALASTRIEGYLLAAILMTISLIGILRPEVLFPVFFIVSLSGNYFGAFPGVGFPRIFGIIILTGTLFRIYIKGSVSFAWWKYYVFIAVATLISYIGAYVDSLNNLMTILLDITVLFSLVNLELSKNELDQLFNMTFLAVVITVIFFALTFLLDPSETLSTSGLRMSIADTLNANTFAQMMAQLGAFCFGFAYISEQKCIKYIGYPLGFLCLYCVILTGSRAGMIGLLLGVPLALLVYFIVMGKELKRFLTLAILVMIGAILFYFILKTNPVLLERINLESIIVSGGSGRWDYIQVELLKIIPQNLFFGVGIGTDNEVAALMPYFSHKPLPSTNILIGLLTQVGLVGFCAYMMFFGKICKESISRIKLNQMILVPLVLILTALINGIGEVVFYERYLWNAISLAALCLTTYQATQEPLSIGQLNS